MASAVVAGDSTVERMAESAEPTAEAMGLRLKLGIEVDGVYRVSGSRLRGAGLHGIDPRKLRLLERGREVAIHITGEDAGSLDPGDSIEFYARGLRSENSRRNVYWLVSGPSQGRRMTTRDVTPSGRAPVQQAHATTVHVEESNAEYWQAMPDGHGQDHYFWRRMMSPSSHTFTVELPDLAVGQENAHIRVALHGRTDPPQNPDHHTRILLNGRPVDEQAWNGRVPFQHSVPVDPALLQAGPNTVTLELLDTGAGVDSVYLNFIQLDYRAELVARDGVLVFMGQAEAGVEYRLGGFEGSRPKLYDITDPYYVARLRLVDVPEPVGFESILPGPRRYLAVAPSAEQSPASIELDAPSDLRSREHGADYIVIAHPTLLPSMAPLLALRAEQGLRTLAVDVTDVYDEFSFGIEDPTAIRDFLRYAHGHWRPPAPAFVVLVGDANRDALDHLGTGTPNLVPTHLFETRNHGQAPGDNFFAAIHGNDHLPDLAIGRIPVRTAAAAEVVVKKIIDYETLTDTAQWNRKALLITDGEPGVTGIQDAQASTFPPSIAVHRMDPGRHAGGTAKAALLRAFAHGAVITSYLGHGSVGSWARQRLLTSEDVPSLANSGKLPFVTALNCINGHFPHPSIPFSLAETLLNTEDRGAVAVLSTTGLGFPREYARLGNALWQRFFQYGELRIGSAVLGAVQEVFSAPDTSRDVLRSLVLLGDPATRLAIDRDGNNHLDRDESVPPTSHSTEGRRP